MNVEIKKLTPAHVEEYINFFETTPHVLGTWDYQDWSLLKEWVNVRDK